MRKVADLLEDALNYPDYDKRINFLLAGLLSADANDTPEKEMVNMERMKEIYKYFCDYTGDKREYIRQKADIIKQYIGVYNE